MKARLVPLVAVVAVAVPVALAVPTDAFAAPYIQWGTAYWVHPNGSFTACSNCTIRWVNNSNGTQFFVQTGPNSVSNVPGKWKASLDDATEYHMYLTYSTNQFTPMQFRLMPLVTGQCTYTKSLDPIIKWPNLGRPVPNIELHLNGGANEYGCPAYPQG